LVFGQVLYFTLGECFFIIVIYSVNANLDFNTCHIVMRLDMICERFSNIIHTLRIPVGCYYEYHYFMLGMYYYLYAYIILTFMQVPTYFPDSI